MFLPLWIIYFCISEVEIVNVGTKAVFSLYVEIIGLPNFYIILGVELELELIKNVTFWYKQGGNEGQVFRN